MRISDWSSDVCSSDLTGLGATSLDCRQDGAALDASSRAGYLFNSTIAGIERADALLIVGSNPRLEAAVLNSRIRKRWLTGKLKVGVIGPQAELTYKTDYLGAGPDTDRKSTRLNSSH